MLKVLALLVTVPIHQVAQTDGTLVTVSMPLASQAPTVMLITIAALIATLTFKLMEVEREVHQPLEVPHLMLMTALILITPAKPLTLNALMTLPVKLQLMLAIIVIIPLMRPTLMKLVPTMPALLLLLVILTI